MIRIIGGTFKRRALKAIPRSPSLRPILARVRKSLFDILRPRLSGASFLDLYAGAGVVGLEALSRGAEKVIFVENDSPTAGLIRKNLESFGLLERARVYRMNALGDLGILPKPFQIIFMGPPYKDSDKAPLRLVEPTLQNIWRAELLGAGGLIVAQHHKKETFALPSEDWTVNRQERYGDTILSFITGN